MILNIIFCSPYNFERTFTLCLSLQIYPLSLLLSLTPFFPRFLLLLSLSLSLLLIQFAFHRGFNLTSSGAVQLLACVWTHANIIEPVIRHIWPVQHPYNNSTHLSGSVDVHMITGQENLYNCNMSIMASISQWREPKLVCVWSEGKYIHTYIIIATSVLGMKPYSLWKVWLVSRPVHRQHTHT